MVEIKLKKRFEEKGRVPLIIDFECTLTKGEVVAVFGPSGSGKTSILKMLSGIIKAQESFIKMGDEIIEDTSSGIRLSLSDRKVSMVFQDRVLFPHMSVLQHIDYAAHSSLDLQDKNYIMEHLDLKELKEFRPHQLSGGKAQCLSIAINILAKPKLLLLDEPVSALDYSLRKRILKNVKALLSKYSISTLVVSHYPMTLNYLSDRVLFLDNGKVQQTLTIEEAQTFLPI